VEDTLPRGVFPRLEDWRPERLLNAPDAWAARLLKQYVGVDTLPTAMLGFNLAGTDDPAVNAYSPISLSSATVAFWGPDFTPAQLAGLDVDGSLFTSGVLLYEDTNSNGVFDGPFLTSGVTAPSFTDRIVPLAQGSLTWPQAPEVIDWTATIFPTTSAATASCSTATRWCPPTWRADGRRACRVGWPVRPRLGAYPDPAHEVGPALPGHLHGLVRPQIRRRPRQGRGKLARILA
jgi:hypothetical protein